MEVPRSGRITLAVVLRFVDIATDALAEAREEIDALNVYPGARRRHRHQHVPHGLGRA